VGDFSRRGCWIHENVAKKKRGGGLQSDSVSKTKLQDERELEKGGFYSLREPEGEEKSEFNNGGRKPWIVWETNNAYRRATMPRVEKRRGGAKKVRRGTNQKKMEIVPAKDWELLGIAIGTKMEKGGTKGTL